MPSSVINHFSYQEDKQILKITFTTGRAYQYLKVPQQIVNQFKIAGSKGRFFNFFIKGHFKYKKIK